MAIDPVPPALRTARLCLRPPTLGDFASSLAMWSDPAVTRHIGGRPNTAEEVWGRLLRYAGHWTLLGYGYWVAEHAETGRYFGEVGFGDYRRDVIPRIDGIPEMGWVLAPHAQRQGFATEAAKAALAWRDATLPPGPTVCLIDPENCASLQVAKKLGFMEMARTHHRGAETAVLHRPPPSICIP